MKIFCFPSEASFFYQKPDTALFKSDEDFYIPPFCESLGITFSLVVKINRLGRSIATRFANRYYTQYQIGVSIYALDLLQQAQAAAQPWETATCLDYSLPMPREWINKEELPIKEVAANAQLNHKALCIPFNINEERIDQGIACLSQWVYLKMGDLVVFELHQPISVQKGDLIQAAFNGQNPLIDFEIK